MVVVLSGSLHLGFGSIRFNILGPIALGSRLAVVESASNSTSSSRQPYHAAKYQRTIKALALRLSVHQ